MDHSFDLFLTHKANSNYTCTLNIGSSQAVSAGGNYRLVNLANAVYDPFAIGNTTSHYITIPASGLYLIMAGALLNSATELKIIVCKNGNGLYTGATGGTATGVVIGDEGSSSTTAWSFVNCADVLELTAGDQLYLNVFTTVACNVLSSTFLTLSCMVVY